MLEANFAKAIELFRKSADLGFAHAQKNLAKHYMIGIPGVLEDDSAKAIELLTKSADQGFAVAQNLSAHIVF